MGGALLAMAVQVIEAQCVQKLLSSDLAAMDLVVTRWPAVGR